MTWKCFPQHHEPFVRESTSHSDFPNKGPVMMGFYIFFVVTLNKLLNRHLSCWCFEMHWYLCDIITMEVYIYVLYNVSYYRIYLYISFNNFCNVYKSVMPINISWYHVCFCGYWMLHGWFCYDELAKIYFNNRLNVIMSFKTWYDLYGI